MTTEDRGLEALRMIEEELAAPRERAFLDRDALCNSYHKIKSYLDPALELIEKFPIIGTKIGGVVRFLMEIADSVCPAPSG